MTQSGTEPLRWLLLIHQLPTQPLYLRARIHRLLDQAGGIALKGSVYALPHRSQCRKALERIAKEATEGGGHAYVCQARFLDPGTDELLVERSRSARDEDYRSLARILRELDGTPDPEPITRARQKFQNVEKIDFFEAPGRQRVEPLLARLEQRGRKPPIRRRGGTSDLIGRVWVTRRGVQIDRIASAWLIRRYIDPGATFRFIDPTEERSPKELRFDMVGGDYTHEEDRCTFETLLRRTTLSDPALIGVAEIVHDIDIKDAKFSRPEARGIEQLLIGMLVDSPTDQVRLERGFVLFDDLYRSFTRSTARLPERRQPNAKSR
jgi:hypothetical protein